jgi:hypothetical protein
VPPPFYYFSHSGFFWGHGIGLSPGFFYSTLYWPRRDVVILHAPRYCRTYDRRPYRDYYTAGQHWNHNPWHRRGVDYRHTDLRQRYGRSSASGVMPMTASRDVVQPRLPADGGRTDSPTDRVRSTLMRDVEPRAVAPGRRTQPQARSVPHAPPQAVPDSGPQQIAAARNGGRQRDAAADDRDQGGTNRSIYRGSDATLTRQR